jgi:RNA polymerase-interacting CarD/CdnL/TRCF family regulator
MIGYQENERVKYKVGDIIVHWTHGIGTIVGIDQKDMAGIEKPYYVIELKSFKFWVPVEDADEGSIRFPTERIQFGNLFDILRLPGKLLPDYQYQRKIALRDRMQKRSLEDLCHVIRDLTDRSHSHTLNQNDFAVLFRAEEHLLDEWVFSLDVNRPDALRALEVLLQRDETEAKIG